MNATFQARAGLRDPFTAFVCDDATADMLRPIAVEHGWSPEKVNKGGLRNAVQSLSVSASPNILFVDLSESADPLNDINALAEVCEPGTIVIAAGQVNDVRLYRDLVASGIHDYLLKPFSVEQLRDSFAHAQMILSGPRGDAQAEKPHVLSAVIGVRGGVGASTMATSLAWMLGERSHRSTALPSLEQRAPDRPRAGGGKSSPPAGERSPGRCASRSSCSSSATCSRCSRRTSSCAPGSCVRGSTRVPTGSTSITRPLGHPTRDASSCVISRARAMMSLRRSGAIGSSFRSRSSV